MYLIDLLPAGFKGTVLFHTMGWFNPADPSHRTVGYASADPAAIETQLDLIQKWGKGMSISRLGILVDWYWTTKPYTDSVAKLMLTACENRGMRFSLCMDQGISPTQNPAEMVSAFTYAQTNFFGSPVFTRDEFGKIFVIEFTANYADWPTIVSTFGVRVLHWANDAVNGFSWMRAGPTAPATLMNENTRVFMPCLAPGFDDHSIKDSTQSVWGGAARFTDYQNGKTITDAASVISPNAKWVQVVTWNDLEERTGIMANLGFPGLPSDVILPTGNVIPNVFNDPLPGPFPWPTIPSATAGLATDGARIVTTGGKDYFLYAAGDTAVRVVKNKPGRICKISITAVGTAAVSIFDNSGQTNGTVLCTIPASQPVGIYDIQIPAKQGITIQGVASSPAFTLTFN